MDEVKITAILAILRAFFLFFGALGSSIVGWVVVSYLAGNSYLFAFLGGAVLIGVAIWSIIEYFNRVRKL